MEEFGIEYSTQFFIGWAVFLIGLPYTWAVVQQIPFRDGGDEGDLERDGDGVALKEADSIRSSLDE